MGGRIKSTKSLISGENIDEPWKGDTYNTSIGYLLLGKIVPPLWGSINVFQWLTQGLHPGLCRSVVLKGSSTSTQSLLYLIILKRLSVFALLFSCNLEKYITFVTNKSTSLRDDSRAYGCSLGGIFILSVQSQWLFTGFLFLYGVLDFRNSCSSVGVTH